MDVRLGPAFVAGVISLVAPRVVAPVPVYLAHCGDAAGGVVAVSALCTWLL